MYTQRKQNLKINVYRLNRFRIYLTMEHLFNLNTQMRDQLGQISRSLEDDCRDEQTRLPLWYGDRNLDILTPEHWIKSVQVSISPTFYEQLFNTRVFC